MSDQETDKVHFRRRDIVALNDLPSATAEDRILVRGHHPRRWPVSVLRWTLGILLVLALAVGGGIAALEAGFADGFVRDRAQQALAQAVGPENRAELSSVGVRLTRQGRLALEARDVSVERRDGTSKANYVKSVLIGLDPMALLSGRISLTSLEIAGVGLTAPESDGFSLTDLARFRIDATDAMIEEMFLVLNRIARQIEAVKAGAFRFSDITISGRGEGIEVTSAEVRSLDGLNYEITADLVRAGQAITLRATAKETVRGAGLSQITAEIEGFALEIAAGAAADSQNGVSMPMSISFSASRAGPGRGPALSAKVSARDGTLTMGGIAAELRDARISLVYMPAVNKIEITPSVIRIGETVLPFTGGLIDADRVAAVEGAGIAFDVVIKEGLAAPGDSNEAPISFDGKALGRFDAAERLLLAEELALVTPQGDLYGSASWRFVEGISPEINLVAQSPRMTMAAVKQFWPYWVGKMARTWVLENLYGGTVSNGRIQLAAPAGHYSSGDASFNENQLQIDFDVERARMNVAGDIPPLRDIVGHMRLRGSDVSLAIDSGTAFFPTGRSVEVTDARFSIPEADKQPLMADLVMSVSGKADAVAELISYHPINALDQIGFLPGELSGEITSTVTARFGLIAQQSPPPPDWTVDLTMTGVDLAKPVEGRILADMDGSLSVTPDRAELKADALVDGARMTLDVVRPIGDSAVIATRQVSGTLSPEAREKMAPGVSELISGPVGFVLKAEAGGPQLVTLDLKPATLTVPGIGWTKARGVAASLQFVMQTEGDVTRLSDVELSGDGFSANGDVTLSQGRLSAATFDRVALSPRDDYLAEITARAQAYDIKVGGKSIDLRPFLARAKAFQDDTPTNTGTGFSVAVSGAVETLHGYSDERLSSGTVSYKAKGGRIELLNVKAVTSSGQALVMNISGGGTGETVEITSGDAGAIARFSGIYGRMQGGLLNIRLSRKDDSVRRGVIDVRNFVLVGEPRLESLVSTPSRQDGRSLKDAVKADVNVSQASFEVANARLVLGKGGLQVSDGIIRGPEIGASFQGLVSDGKGNIDMTGTLMLVYGINRLFADVPVIGALLGNGRDRGLFGITFRLAGKTESPLLQVNPLSVIAPGVFRTIFEFKP